MTKPDDKIGISIRTSIILTTISLIVIFFPRHVLHPFIHDIACALYFIGVVGLFLNLTIKRLSINKRVVSIPLTLVLTIVIMVLTVMAYQKVTNNIKKEIELDGQVTDGIIKSVNETTIRNRRRYFVTLEYYANSQTFTPTFDISNSDARYYQVDDTVLVQYSKKNPNDYQIIENKRLQEDVLRIVKPMDKGS